MLPGTAAKFPGPSAQVRGVALRAPRRARRFDGWTERERRDVPPLRRAAQEPPLKGLRVVDVTTAWLGPYAGMLLADSVVRRSSHFLNGWIDSGEPPLPESA